MVTEIGRKAAGGFVGGSWGYPLCAGSYTCPCPYAKIGQRAGARIVRARTGTGTRTTRNREPERSTDRWLVRDQVAEPRRGAGTDEDHQGQHHVLHRATGLGL